MKIKVIILSLLASVVVGSAMGQVEQDDMYFNAKDRAKLREAEKSSGMALASSRNSRKENDEDGNPTDSYSARNVNPEYTSRAQSNTSQEDEEDYFVTNYRYANQGYYNNFNNNYNNWYNNPWYRSNYWGSSIYGWNSPYYGSAYDAYGNPWANPYYRSGWSSGFSFYYGSSWNYGMNNCFSCSPYAYYDPYYDFYNPYYSYNPYSYWGPSYMNRPVYSYGGGWNRPTRVVYIQNDDYRGTYGKRSSRSSQIDRDNDRGTRGAGRIVEGRDGRSSSGGRINREQEYYNNTWRNTNRSNTNSSYSTPSRTVTPSWNNNNNSNSNSRSSWESQQRSTPSYSPAPSRSSDAGRSYTPSGGGSSGSGSRSSRGN